MLTTDVQMNTTALSQIQRQSIHECIIECHQQNFGGDKTKFHFAYGKVARFVFFHLGRNEHEALTNVCSWPVSDRPV